jgi:hypothetical protein
MDNSAEDLSWSYITNMSDFGDTHPPLSPVTGDVGHGVLFHDALGRSEGIHDPTGSEIVLVRNASSTDLSYHDETQHQPPLLIYPGFNSTEASLENASSNSYDGNRTSGDGYTFVEGMPFYSSGAIEFQGPWDEHQV